MPAERMVMKKTLFLRLFVLVIIAGGTCTGMLWAQHPDRQKPTITVAVEGLTSEMRDGINRDLQQRGDMRLVFACVPAGIMVFEQQQQGSREQLRAGLTPVLEHRIARQKISMEAMDRKSAEERCAQARNQ